MIDVPINLVSAIGMLNGACRKSDVIWQIIKYPDEDAYHALLTPMHNDNALEAAVSVEAEYIDDLFERIINKLPITF
jgi:hypothetical protein